MSWSHSDLKVLRELLATLYPTVEDSRRLVRDSGMNILLVAFDPKPINNWFQILEESERQSRTTPLLRRALEEYPDHDGLKLALEQGRAPAPIPAPQIDDLPWRGDSSEGLEQILGARSTLVPISYLRRGLDRAQAVARVALPGSYASGFLVEDNLLVTNHHVLPDPRVAASARVTFNHQLNVQGLAEAGEELALAPEEWFVTDRDDDWTATRVKGDPIARWGAIPLGSASISVGDRVNIIQHPGGGYKQLSYFSNVVAFVGAGRVQYLTDTLPGSSGSPVFDKEWNLVALHHSGGWLVEPGGRKATQHFRNEGISIEVVRRGLAERRAK